MTRFVEVVKLVRRYVGKPLLLGVDVVVKEGKEGYIEGSAPIVAVSSLAGCY